MISATRSTLLASTIVASAFWSFAASAQTNAPQEATPAVDVGESAADICATNPGAQGCGPTGDTIVVTGSRIASPSLVSASPLQVIDARDIAESGVVNVQELLLENPAFGTPGFSRTNSAFSTASAGISTVDLRNLGSSRTLVLINGRRTVSGLPGSSAVDLNTIPTQFIQRVDVLTGGSSSIYGSDAVAGVVNFVYRKDFEGLQIDGQTGITEEGDGARYQVGVTMGSSFADGRGNLMLHGGYTKEEAIGSADRRNTFYDDTACYAVSPAQGGCSTTADDNIFAGYEPFFSGFSPNTTVTARPGFSRIFNSAGNLALVNTNGLVHADGVPSTVRACTVADPCQPSLQFATGFNRQQFRTIALPIERYLIALRGNYEIIDGVNAFIEGNYAKSSTTTLIEPFAYQTSGTTGSFPATGGYFNIETRLADGTIARNPFVSDALYAEARDQTGDGLRDVSFTKRLTEFGPRTYTADRNTFRLLGGLEGSVFGDWTWDAFYSYGETTESQVGSGQVNLANFANALQVIPGELGPVCADAVARSQGCAPANVFGPAGTLSPAAINYIQAAQSRNVRISQKLAGANLSGDLIDLWDGAFGVAVGVEYRAERSSAVNDPLSTAGLNGGNALPPTRGSFDVTEGYGEVSLPLLRDRPFFQDLTLRAAGRISDYSTVGTVYSYNYGGEYSPVSDVRFRVVRARATRAPNIGELFAGRSQTFPSGLVDPCLGVTAATGGTLGTTCLAAPGVAANIAANGGTFTLNQSDVQGVSGFNGGNPDLQEERADTFTAGVVINPTSFGALRNLVLTVDYFDIDIKDAIFSTPRQFILDQCYNQNNPIYCAFITRRATVEGPNSAGSLQFINTGPTNSGGFTTKGIDATASYRQPLEQLGLGSGSVNLRVSYTHVIKLEQQPQPDADINTIEGEIGAARDKFTASIGYDQSGVGLTARGTFIGASYLDDQFTGVTAGAEGSDLYRVNSVFYLDLQARIAAGRNYEFNFGVDNALNETGPTILTNLPSNATGTDTDAGTYDPIGRRYYVGARLKF